MSGLVLFPVGVPSSRRLSRSRGRRSAMSQRITSDSHHMDVNIETERQEELQTKPVETFAPPSCAPREIFVPPSCSPRQLHRCELMPELPPSSEILAADRPGILLGGEGC
eukprot:gnl/TRDRNA2_/TRDRNA2_176959_c10_seq5.p3 gnl/TRDRNA2_/TRDRNA2_176959_c10~~gnl/TRDRNA2_/TRDRNA2_176959_c10_seq5.p3  ORF type:complete len:110 (-),score=17.74 gnl/TRDRNA2_/TRDRNA2_176959_c10_seq5:425-754(-)